MFLKYSRKKMSGNILLEKMSIYCSNGVDAYLLFYGKRWETGRSSVSAAICRQQVTVDKSTDTRWPHYAYGQCWTQATAIALLNGIGDAAVTIRLNGCRPCSGTHCRIRTFTTAPSLTAWTASTEKNSVAMTGLSDPRHCGTLLFIGAAPIFLFSVFQSIAATVGSATIYVFTGFHPGEPFQQDVPSTSGSVQVACHNLTCGEGIFFWLWHKKSPDLLRRLVFFLSRPEHPSFAAPRL